MSAVEADQELYIQDMQTKLELSHWAGIRERPAANGHTCDWRLEITGQNMQLYIERVICNLHPTFPQPKRVLKEPPYVLSSTGFGSSEVMIEVHFRKLCGTKKVQFAYDLYLPGSATPEVNHSRSEILTFCNPCDELQDLLKRRCGGWVGRGKSSPVVPPAPPAKPKAVVVPQPKQAASVAAGKDMGCHGDESQADSDRKGSTSSGSHKQKKKCQPREPSSGRDSAGSTPSPAEPPFVPVAEHPGRSESDRLAEKRRLKSTLFDDDGDNQDAFPPPAKKHHGVTDGTEKDGRKKSEKDRGGSEGDRKRGSESKSEKDHRKSEKDTKKSEKDAKKSDASDQKKSEKDLKKTDVDSKQSSSDMKRPSKESETKSEKTLGKERDKDHRDKERDKKRDKEKDRSSSKHADSSGNTSSHKHSTSLSKSGSGSASKAQESRSSTSRTPDVAASSERSSSDNMQGASFASTMKHHERSLAARDDMPAEHKVKDENKDIKHKKPRTESESRRDSKSNQDAKTGSLGKALGKKSTLTKPIANGSACKDDDVRCDSKTGSSKSSVRSESKPRSEKGGKSIPGGAPTPFHGPSKIMEKPSGMKAPEKRPRSVSASSDDDEDGKVSSVGSPAAVGSSAAEESAEDSDHSVAASPAASDFSPQSAGSPVPPPKLVSGSSVLDEMKTDSSEDSDAESSGAAADDVQEEDEEDGEIISPVPPIKIRVIPNFSASTALTEKSGDDRRKSGSASSAHRDSAKAPVKPKPTEDKIKIKQEPQKRPVIKTELAPEHKLKKEDSQSGKSENAKKPDKAKAGDQAIGSIKLEKAAVSATSLHTVDSAGMTSQQQLKGKASVTEKQYVSSAPTKPEAFTNLALKPHPSKNSCSASAKLDKSSGTTATERPAKSPSAFNTTRPPDDKAISKNKKQKMDLASPFVSSPVLPVAADDPRDGAESDCAYDGTGCAPNGVSLESLLVLQRRLMGITDEDTLQRVVDIIEETGAFHLNPDTFDFDLCNLDRATIDRIWACLGD